MQATEARKAPPTDIATKIAVTMRQMGMAGLPRNYELLYEAYTGFDQDLIAAIVALGNRATQEKLDAIAAKHLSQERDRGIVEDARDLVKRKIEEVMMLMLKERASLESYGKFLGETVEGMAGRAHLTRELLEKVISVMATATATTIDHGRKVATTMADQSHELEELRGKMEEYKRLADTDPLTQLLNRRAFDRMLWDFHRIGGGGQRGALIVVDIDDFKRVNDGYGHPAGDRVIQKVALIIRRLCEPKFAVARTGGEEFVLIVPALAEDDAAALAEDLRSAIERTSFLDERTGEECGPLTISVGVCMKSEATGPDDLYAKADRALYTSKVNGRNRVTLHSALATAARRKDWLLYKSE